MRYKTSYNTDRLEEAGWGVITAVNDPARDSILNNELAPLLKRRHDATPERFKTLEYRPGETAAAFLARYGLRSGFTDPDLLPYYLLIVASPEEIPFTFQNNLSASYAVGRLWFDNPQGFASYARHLVDFERRGGNSEHSTAFFGAANPDDPASNFAAQMFLRPLFERMQRENRNWKTDLTPPEAANKASLREIMERGRLGLLVTTGQGVTFPPDHPRQRIHQGGIVCQDWPGPKAWKNELPPDFYFSGEDIHPQIDLSGMISFHLSDYSLGTPVRSDAQAVLFSDAPLLSNRPFIAGLPQELLARGRALAAVGLIDKFWNTAFPNLTLFAPDMLVVAESCLRRLLQGATLGVAMEVFRQRATELNSQFSMLREEAQFGKKVDSQEIVATWATMSTILNLAIFGDPAVRLISNENIVYK